MRLCKLKGLFCVLLVILFSSAVAIWYGKWIPNSALTKQYPIRGIDISHHQGDIDWDRVPADQISFIYIKVTEGKDYTDSNFKRNWEEAKKRNIPHGAYHFFTFRSDGRSQAEHFIAALGKDETALPPVVDLEFWGNAATRPTVESFRRELDVFLTQIRKVYGKEPMIYTDYTFYNHYLSGYPLQRLWIRDIVGSPNFHPSMKWLFWQYTSRGHVPGIPTFVDWNVFRGDKEDFKNFSSDPMMK